MKRHKIPMIALGMTIAGISSSCVHEFPEAGESAEVRLTLVHNTEWAEYDYVYNRRDGNTRGDETPTFVRYVIKAYRRGAKSGPEYEFTFTSDDLSLSPYSTSIRLPEGEWDLYVWQDLTTGGNVFYDATDFGRISYTGAYTGHTDLRDTFEGHAGVEVTASYNAGHYVDATIQLERPMAKYVFIAKDFRKFYDETLLPALAAQNGVKSDQDRRWTTLSAQEQTDALKGWSVTAYYPLFMPSVYDTLNRKVRDSSKGMKYPATITPISDDEAILAFDYVLMNPDPGGAQVQLVLHTPTGTDVTMTPLVSVPLKRACITYVRGNFLTTGTQGGLDIDFTFSGDINIEI